MSKVLELEETFMELRVELNQNYQQIEDFEWDSEIQKNCIKTE